MKAFRKISISSSVKELTSVIFLRTSTMFTGLTLTLQPGSQV